MGLKDVHICNVWIELIIVETENWNWKHCSKIIFKCVNSVVGLIFNEKFAKKWILWIREQCTNALFIMEKSTSAGWTKKKKKSVGQKRRHNKQLNPNTPYKISWIQTLPTQSVYFSSLVTSPHSTNKSFQKANYCLD